MSNRTRELWRDLLYRGGREYCTKRQLRAARRDLAARDLRKLPRNKT